MNYLLTDLYVCKYIYIYRLCIINYLTYASKQMKVNIHEREIKVRKRVGEKERKRERERERERDRERERERDEWMEGGR